MVVLHFAAIENNPFNGVCVAAPQHVISQKEFATVGFINIKNIEIDALKDYPGTQMKFVKPFDIKAIPDPFNKPDIVVFHECYRMDYLQIAKNLRENGIPYVEMPHGELGEDAQKKKHLKKVVANILLFNRFTKGAEAIQCLSKKEMEGTHFGCKKILVTNGVKIPEKKKEEFNKDKIKFIYIGRLDAFHKGLDMMIEAIKSIKNEMIANNATLDIYGPDVNGRFENVKSMIDDANVGDFVKLHHEVTGEYKEQLLLDTDIFIQTSRFEGMPLGVLEALSYGIPCLITEGTNLADVIENNKAGWNAGDNPQSIARAIQKTLDDREEYYQYGENGREYIRRVFSWEIIAKQAINAYRDLLR